MPGDRKDEVKTSSRDEVGQQLAAILDHIEDLQVVNTRVRESDMADGYLDPLASDKSELRLDY